MKKPELYFNTIDTLVQKILVKGDFKVSKTYSGYISAMGAAVIQSGLLLTLAFYSEQGSAEQDRPKILKIIWKTLEVEESSFLDNDLISQITEVEPSYLFRYAMLLKKAQPQNFKSFEKRVMNIAIALKLVLRTYNLED